MKITSLIFDLDGTLIDSSDGVVDAVNFAFRQMGVPEQPSEIIKPYIGYPLQDMFAQMTNAPVDLLYRHFQTRAATTVVDSAVILDNVTAVLNECRARGFQMAIATTKIRLHVDAIIKKFGWEHLFDATVAGNDVRQVKPHPEAIHLAISRLGTAAQNSLVIGDTENDVLAAQQVPVRVAAVTSPYGGDSKVRALQPTFYLSDLRSLIPTLHQINEPAQLIGQSGTTPL